MPCINSAGFLIVFTISPLAFIISMSSSSSSSDLMGGRGGSWLINTLVNSFLDSSSRSSLFTNSSILRQMASLSGSPWCRSRYFSRFSLHNCLLATLGSIGPALGMIIGGFEVPVVVHSIGWAARKSIASFTTSTVVLALGILTIAGVVVVLLILRLMGQINRLERRMKP